MFEVSTADLKKELYEKQTKIDALKQNEEIYLKEISSLKNRLNELLTLSQTKRTANNSSNHENNLNEEKFSLGDDFLFSSSQTSNLISFETLIIDRIDESITSSTSSEASVSCFKNQHDENNQSSNSSLIIEGPIANESIEITIKTQSDLDQNDELEEYRKKYAELKEGIYIYIENSFTCFCYFVWIK